ncbi:hypothetical protein Lesp02_03770 [Lentzea sp. NBRC 105346]|uniref:hypothetical protein n=1 Tax=Lentzea sp. NBRC 105346 TaxID=3032205 RepID=UPI0024A488DD|nr:hypothetical protein [Lentzea sp. NBRC 105346]GLZ28187.1 hypothetical protein Lesp02_03770 [Lentzea sp. NBRC 105346]
MSSPSTWTIAVRTAIIEAMTASDEPLSTEELRDALHGPLLPWRKDPRLYHHLRALERMGVCCRQRWPQVERRVADPRTSLYWRYTQDEAIADLITELDADH